MHVQAHARRKKEMFYITTHSTHFILRLYGETWCVDFLYFQIFFIYNQNNQRMPAWLHLFLWLYPIMPVCGMVHIKERLLLIGKSSPCGSSRFLFPLSEWSFTICPMPYNNIKNVLSMSLNKTFPSFLPSFVTPVVEQDITQWVYQKGSFWWVNCYQIIPRLSVH